MSLCAIVHVGLNFLQEIVRAFLEYLSPWKRVITMVLLIEACVQYRFEKRTFCVCVLGSLDHNRSAKTSRVGQSEAQHRLGIKAFRITKIHKSIHSPPPLSSPAGYSSYFILRLRVCVAPSLEITYTANDLPCPQRSLIE